MNLDVVFDYNMTPPEVAAYKICLIWCKAATKKFPDRKIITLKKKGDPRTSFLFKWAYKFVRETQGLIPQNEYFLYVKAQLDILAAIIDQNGRSIAEISPTCLAGDKAWVRWKLWKRKYDKIVNSAKSKEEIGLIVPHADIMKELKSTKNYLEGKFEGVPKEEQIIMASRDIERCIALGKISGYYATLSPWVKKHCKNLTIDLGLYPVTSEIQNYFKETFSHEFA